jgi:adenosylcobinamide kinase/adenosylcobinamide-phosphate guanylyltransferase
VASALGGDRVLYVATALPGRDRDLERRVRLHRERRPARWGTLELGGGDLGAVLEGAQEWRAILLDSLTLWVSARMENEMETLEDMDRFLEEARTLSTPLVLVSDEVGLGVVPESAAGRRFRDALGVVNQRAAAVAGEVYLCIAGIGMRVK